MSKGQMLRVLVNERLTAAAEEIFELFERTIAEYEEELSRAKHEENHGTQRGMELLNTGGLQPRAGSSPSGLDQDVKEEPEEQIKQEEEQLPVCVPESSAVCVKKEESSLLQHQQTEHREEKQGEDISSEPHFISETKGDTEHMSDTDNDDTDNDDNWGPFSCSTAQMETEADGEHYNQVQTKDRSTPAQNSGLSPKNKSAPETNASVKEMKEGNEKGIDQGPERKCVCAFCLSTFTCNATLEEHMKNHTGARPYSCSICEKTFAHKNILVNHRRMHTGEKPYSCSHCGKTFAHNSTLNTHLRVHTGEKPFRCTLCEKKFAQRSTLDKHLRIHRGEKPYICSVCEKPFAQKSDLNAHTRIHTGEKPYSCAVCNKEFTVKSNLYRHMGTHSHFVERHVAKSGSSL